jgi:hypothetical protein
MLTIAIMLYSTYVNFATRKQKTEAALARESDPIKQQNLRLELQGYNSKQLELKNKIDITRDELESTLVNLSPEDKIHAYHDPEVKSKLTTLNNLEKDLHISLKGNLFNTIKKYLGF